MSWTEGYMSEIGYIAQYYQELAPANIELALLNKGVRQRKNRPFRYLELGFGQGVSLAIHAAACDGEFWGNDFNPVHAAHARELVTAAGVDAKIFDDSFADLAKREDLPEFDVIALHGIWSWINEDNRRIIIDLIRRKLAIGGVLFISYNSTPGWAPSMPLRHLLNLHANYISGKGTHIVKRVDDSLAFAQKLIDVGALYFKANPSVAERLKQLNTLDRRYLAHEYFNADWHPMPFSQVAESLNEAKVQFAASGFLGDHINVVNYSQESAKFVASISDTTLAESLSDFCLNRQFRRDLFVKGPRSMTNLERMALFGTKTFVLSHPPSLIKLKISGPQGEATLKETFYIPLLTVLAEDDYCPKSVEYLLEHPQLKGCSQAEIMEAMVILSWQSHVSLAQNETCVQKALERTRGLNEFMLSRIGGDLEYGFLASPVTGCGHGFNPTQMLFIRSIVNGTTDLNEMAAELWDHFQARGQKVHKEGKPIEDKQESLAEILRAAQEFVPFIPVIKALKII